MEIIITTVLISTVIFSLYQVRSNSIFILNKSKETKKDKEILSLLFDSMSFSKRNETIYLDKYFNMPDDIRREFKEYKVKVKDELIDKTKFEKDEFNILINKFKTEYILENDIKQKIYKFELSL